MIRVLRGAVASLLLAGALAGCSSKSPPPPARTCASTGEGCATLPCCGASDRCDATSKTCVTASCVGTGASCAGGVACCNAPADTCTSDTHVCATTGACAGTLEACSDALPCCHGADTCVDPDGLGTVCTPPATCINTGATTCSVATPCCSPTDSCVGGKCIAPAVCAGTNEACSGTKPCCSSSDSCGWDASAVATVCLAPASCKGEGAGCLGDGECCSGLTCPAGSCAVPACGNETAACTLPAQCCTGLGCAGNACVLVTACKAEGQGCADFTECCTNSCANHVCTAPVNECLPLTSSCTADQDCCTGLCDPDPVDTSVEVCTNPGAQCAANGASCAGAGDCCSGICNGSPSTCAPAAFCVPPGDACTSSGECCFLSCVGNACGDQPCKKEGTTCNAGSECCTGLCTSGACAALPGGNACRTLGDSCSAPGDCCSKNCIGNACAPAYACHAYFDICYANAECCSGVCDTTLSNPGRCKQMPGSCTQDGNPCDNGSNCCTRLCLDLGSGVSVCQPASGCRMTGDYCDKTQSCCGGSPDGLPVTSPHTPTDPYGVYCDTTGKRPSAPYNDPSSKDDFRCSGGTACNPPGNICGGSGEVNASQNCCNGGKSVCKPDSSGIWRCFGGCPNDDCASCPTGYDANDPACCIPATADPEVSSTASVCQFRDQCCNGAPCVPNSEGILHCTIAPTCTAQGGTCSGPDSNDCCAPYSCLDPLGNGSYECDLPTGTGCFDPGAACTTAAGTAAHSDECCSTICVGSQCVNCAPNGAVTDGPSQCCSDNWDDMSGMCIPPCTGTGGACTYGECCAGLVCNKPTPTSPSGTCGGSACVPLDQACTASMPCCTGSCVTGDWVPCATIDYDCTCLAL